ncbi:L,D-transpeptidase, partial [Mycobacterium sp. ITM-2017-0098]
MSPAHPLPSINRRRALAALAVGVVAPGALAACMSTDGKPSEAAGEDAPKAPTVTYEPSDGSVDVVPTVRVSVDVQDGWLQKVSLLNDSGNAVKGTLNRDRTSFTIAEPLGYGASYTWAGTVVGEDGKAVPLEGSLTTVTPATEVNGQFQLSDGQTVGVAA